MSQPELFEAYPNLAKTIPWVPLGNLPTPVERLNKLGAQLGYPSLWIKRDDLSSTKMGGNKVRIMEFLLAADEGRGQERGHLSGRAREQPDHGFGNLRP